MLFDTHALARVVADHGAMLRVCDDQGESLVVLAGRLRREGVTAAVGDYVRTGEGVIHEVLPRRTVLRRSSAGTRTKVQILAANVDTALLVMGLDDDFNRRRLERYLVLVWDGGVRPVIVLNKSDLCNDAESRQAEVEDRYPGVPVYCLSATYGTGIEPLQGELAAGQTLVLLGSSGVGKSTLTNRLLGEERLLTSAVREDDGRGRHTTTHRELLLLPGGAALIDTPGLREVALWEGDDVDRAFPHLAALAAGCHFNDCSHHAEPGCAIQEALADGSLEEADLAGWRKLRRERRHQASRQDQGQQLAEKRRHKALTRAVRDKNRWR